MKSKTVAILLTFFLGGFGIHKFYLGHNFAGVLYLVFSWTFIPALFAIFDFIGLLLMSDQTFNAQYNLSGTSFNSAEEYEEKRRKFLDSI